jgi:DNA-directed RNA polymerase
LSISLNFQLLRDAFVELYSQPILETLKKSLEERFSVKNDINQIGTQSIAKGKKGKNEIATAIFPPIPARGTFNISKVVESKYFFH